jgi:hypothetical protein
VEVQFDLVPARRFDALDHGAQALVSEVSRAQHLDKEGSRQAVPAQGIEQKAKPGVAALVEAKNAIDTERRVSIGKRQRAVNVAFNIRRYHDALHGIT